MSDDHASQALSCYGSKINATPNIDRIANEGMRFDHCYVTNSICTPSRAAIITGTHNHVNQVTTLHTYLDNRLPNVAKHLQAGGYQTAIIGKWHLGQGERHWPTGFNFWSVLPGQGVYYDPVFYEMGKKTDEKGYVTDIITDKCIEWLKKRDSSKPFFLMCHHKAPHRPWYPKREHRELFAKDIPVPETFDDNYANRARAAAAARMRIVRDMTYDDLDLIHSQESTGGENSELKDQFVPHPYDLDSFVLRCRNTGQSYTFKSQQDLARFKYERFLRKYLQCVHSIDENVGRLLNWLDETGLRQVTVVIYTSDQGFFLGEHGWYDKRFIYEESFRMPFVVRYPELVRADSTCKAMVSNVDFASTFLDLGQLPIPNYMQGRSVRPLMEGMIPADWTDIAYHRYWMNQDSSHNAYAHYGIRSHRYKLIYWYNSDCGQEGAYPGTDVPEWELFDLERDPLELNNVYNAAEYVEVVREMTEKLDSEMSRIGDLPEH